MQILKCYTNHIKPINGEWTEYYIEKKKEKEKAESSVDFEKFIYKFNLDRLRHENTIQENEPARAHNNRIYRIKYQEDKAKKL